MSPERKLVSFFLPSFLLFFSLVHSELKSPSSSSLFHQVIFLPARSGFSFIMRGLASNNKYQSSQRRYPSLSNPPSNEHDYTVFQLSSSDAVTLSVSAPLSASGYDLPSRMLSEVSQLTSKPGVPRVASRKEELTYHYHGPG